MFKDVKDMRHGFLIYCHLDWERVHGKQLHDWWWKLQREEGAQQDRKQEGELIGEEMVALQLLYRLRLHYSYTQDWKRSQVRRGATGRGLRRLMQQGTTTQIWHCMPASVIVFLCIFSFMSILEGQREHVLLVKWSASLMTVEESWKP